MKAYIVSEEVLRQVLNKLSMCWSDCDEMDALRTILAKEPNEPAAWVCLFQRVIQDEFLFNTESEATKYMRQYSPEDQQEMEVQPLYQKDL
jgi:hypothetical protein